MRAGQSSGQVLVVDRPLRYRRRRAIVVGACFWLFLAAGCRLCGSPPEPKPHPMAWNPAPGGPCTLAFPEKLDEGYTIVLPGVMGSAPLDHGIVKGLVDADVPTAIELYDWTAGPLWLIYNLRALDRNRKESRKIAARIVAYQDHYPGRPVYLVGYSGGGGVAVLTLEAMPPGRKITKAILLAPTLAQDYNLQVALSHTEQGIESFHSAIDVPVMVVATMAVGTTEGKHTFTAGAFGFRTPQSADGPRQGQYAPHLVEHAYNWKMIESGHAGGHFGWANPNFVAKWVAPMLDPPPGSEIPASLDPQADPYQLAVHETQQGHRIPEDATVPASWTAERRADRTK